MQMGFGPEIFYSLKPDEVTALRIILLISGFDEWSEHRLQK